MLPHISLAEGTEVELAQPSGRLRLRLKKQLQQTRHFALYDYKVMENSRESGKTASPQHVDEDFSEAWEIL